MTAKWNIDVAAVSDVLQKTATAVEPFNAHSKSYNDRLNNVTVALKWDIFTVVAVAVSEYGAHWQPIIQAAATQVEASLTGATNAVKAYNAGQTEMAANAQRAAGNGVVPGTASQGRARAL
ncbi:hypothetical protein HPO96_10315 [Kribbella sandramycini]|uniref:Excreted virulence factor EspC (Type VII ESX diderm) n=1 Tax=Kribbella sandramycini TaxID=60450 RepID=A0A7Y4NZA3_9ACTN|nr:hypothetical protein [Kribbella sandramycini]NOL40638.1 hypothetical protein [Kribbella sandramycini]